MTRPTQTYPCPWCKKPLYSVYKDDGKVTSDSVPLRDDEHGKHAHCSHCRRKVRLVRAAGDLWHPVSIRRFCDELRGLVKSGPGANERAMRQVQAIVDELQYGAHAYIREKAGTVLEDFELWYSSRRWQKFARDPRDFEARLLISIEKLEGAFRNG